VVGKSLNEIADAAQAVREDGLGRGLRPATIKRRLAILRRVARLAANEWAWTDRNLGARVKLLPGERARTVSLSAEQVSKLLRACPDAQTRAAVLLASLTGLREGELLRLRPKHYRKRPVVTVLSASSN
jgi:integrase